MLCNWQLRSWVVGVRLGSQLLQSVLGRVFKMARLGLHHLSDDRPAD